MLLSRAVPRWAVYTIFVAAALLIVICCLCVCIKCCCRGRKKKRQKKKDDKINLIEANGKSTASLVSKSALWRREITLANLWPISKTLNLSRAKWRRVCLLSVSSVELPVPLIGPAGCGGCGLRFHQTGRAGETALLAGIRRRSFRGDENSSWWFTGQLSPLGGSRDTLGTFFLQDDAAFSSTLSSAPSQGEKDGRRVFTSSQAWFTRL